MHARRTTVGSANERSEAERPPTARGGPPPLRIRVLGELELRLGEVPLPALESARAESLLAYLVLHRSAPQPRQRLAFVLWPDSTEPQARTNLRHVLHNLRRALPEADRFLDVTQRTLRWRADAPFRLDLDDFERALERAGQGGADGGLAALREAADAYAGDLLQGSYDEWVLDERERLRRRWLDALERLASLLGERGEHAEAIRYAERLVRHDPLREETYRLLMALHDARGDRARALRAYHACSAALERELGVEPSTPTREAYEGLVPAAREPDPGAPGPRRLRGPVLVGRASERTRLTELWRASERGRAQFVLVTGEPGIGKTRLVEELRSWCAHRGAVTAEARSYAAEGALAYGPVVAWLRSEPLAAHRGRLRPGRLAELARVLPELSEAPGVPRPQPLPESEQRRRLFDALARAILAPAAPLLLVSDDLQWCDRETLGFLHYLLRTEPDAPLLVAATARHEEIDDHHRLHELLTGLRALERIVEIDLGRLSRQETAVLAGRLAGRELHDVGADRLFAETEGNPLFVVESLRAGRVDDEGEGASISPRVQAVIEARLAQLSGPARDVAGIAATVGRAFTTEVLAEVSEAGDAALVRGLDELWRRRIVRDQGADAYDFTHDKIREVAYLALSPAQRRRTHLLVARALERLRAGDDRAPVSGQLAAHYDRAGEAAAAASWYEQAAGAALGLHANVEAIRLLGRGLELVRTLPPEPDRDARELALVTAVLAPLGIVDGYVSGRLDEAQQRGLELSRGLGIEPGPPLLRSLALAGLARHDFDGSRRYGERLRARGERDGDDVLLVESDYVLGVAAFWQGELLAAERHFEAAVERYRPEHRATHLIRYGLDPQVVCLSRLSNTLWFLGRPEEATRARDRVLVLAGEVGHQPTEATALVFAALLAVELGDHDGTRRCLAALDARSAEGDVRVVEVKKEALAGYVDVLDGEREAGLARIRRALADAREAEHAPGLHAAVMRLLLEGCAVAGDPRAGLAAADAALATAGPRVWEAETRRLRAEFLAALGAGADQVGAELERALAVARRQRARSLELRVAASAEALLGHR